MQSTILKPVVRMENLTFLAVAIKSFMYVWLQQPYFIIMARYKDFITDSYIHALLTEHIINSYILDQNDNNLLFWKFKRPDKIIYPNINDIQINTVASCGYCFHSKFRYSSIWINGQGGDFNYVNGLIIKNKFDIYFIDEVLTKTTFEHNKKGNYGNKEI